MSESLKSEERNALRREILAKVVKRLSPMHPPDYPISEGITSDMLEIIDDITSKIHEAQDDDYDETPRCGDCDAPLMQYCQPCNGYVRLKSYRRPVR